MFASIKILQNSVLKILRKIKVFRNGQKWEKVGGRLFNLLGVIVVEDS